MHWKRCEGLQIHMLLFVGVRLFTSVRGSCVAALPAWSKLFAVQPQSSTQRATATVPLYAKKVCSTAVRACIMPCLFTSGAKIRAWACDQAGRPEATGSSPHRVPQPPVKREVHAEAKEDDEEEGGC